MTKLQLPTEAELHAMISEARRAVKGLKDDLRSALLNGVPTSAIRDRTVDTQSRIRMWETMLEEIAEQAAKVVTDRVAALRLQIGVAATARIAEVLAGLQPPPFPTAQIEGIPL